MENLDGRKALVTGSSRGIGKAVALELASHGADVAVNYRARGDLAEEVAREIAALGRNALAVGADVGNPEEASALVAETIESLGGLDILVNNAGIWQGSTLDLVEPEMLDRILATNVKGAFNVSQPAVQYMKETGWGRIINMSSILGISGYPGDTMYSCTKSALIGFTKSLAKELVQYGITVNSVAPGFIITDMNDQVDEEMRARILRGIPMRRWGLPEEVADMVVFLVEKGDYITGQMFTVDGGFTI